MKSTFIALGLAALIEQSYAFPAIAEEAVRIAAANAPEQKRQLVSPGFNAGLQYVSNKGAHKFVAPSKTDLRGPCPGLNAMANHNYIPHNGVATIDQFIKGTNYVFGMGLDLATFLATYGAVIDGDLTSWSIGGPPPASLTNGLGLLSQPQGISGSHNKYESDASPTRGDLYEYGNDYLLQMSQFKDLYNLQKGKTDAQSNYNLPLLTDFRAYRFQQSINDNPYFFNGPFTGVAVQPAAYTFIYRFMANHSAEYPEGRLSKSVLKSFFSITGPDNALKYTPGYEKIPDNWYKRAIGDEYTIPFFQTDLTNAALKYPQFLSVGGNTGTTNSFTGVDITNLTGGVYNSQTLLQGNNAACFAYQNAQQGAPDLLKGVFTDTTAALAKLNNAFNNAYSALGGCPQLQSIDESQFDKYPGYSKLKSNGAY